MRLKAPKWLIEVEDYSAGRKGYRLFGTNWDTKIGIIYRKTKLPRGWFDYQFYDGYMEIHIKHLKIRLRRHGRRARAKVYK